MPYVTHEELEDLRPVLEPLRSGHYSAKDLYWRHKSVMEQKGRRPVHPVRFGQILTAYGALRKAKWDSEERRMVKGWMI
jgi:predicted metal-dependent hydrolase